jgi:hypothetical protein
VEQPAVHDPDSLLDRRRRLVWLFHVAGSSAHLAARRGGVEEPGAVTLTSGPWHAQAPVNDQRETLAPTRGRRGEVQPEARRRASLARAFGLGVGGWRAKR